MDDKLFRDYVIRINDKLNERDKLNKEISALYEEARNEADLVPKVLRQVISRNRTSTPEELLEVDDLLVDYECALDGPTRAILAKAREGKSVRQIAKETGMSKSEVGRRMAGVPSKKNSRDSASASAEVPVT